MKKIAKLRTEGSPLGGDRLPPIRHPRTAASLEQARVYCSRMDRTHKKISPLATWSPRRLPASIFATSTPTGTHFDELGAKWLTPRLAGITRSDGRPKFRRLLPRSPRHPALSRSLKQVRQFDIPSANSPKLGSLPPADRPSPDSKHSNDVWPTPLLRQLTVGHLVLLPMRISRRRATATLRLTGTALQ